MIVKLDIEDACGSDPKAAGRAELQDGDNRLVFDLSRFGGLETLFLSIEAAPTVLQVIKVRVHPRGAEAYRLQAWEDNADFRSGRLLLFESEPWFRFRVFGQRLESVEIRLHLEAVGTPAAARIEGRGRRQRERLNRHCRRLEESLQDRNERLRQLRDRACDLELQKRLLEGDNAGLRDRVTWENQARQALLRSGSWRASAPLRRLASARRAIARWRQRKRYRHMHAYRLIRQSGMFAADYYLRSNRDVDAAGVDPLVHYIEHGEGEGRCPHPMFDPDYYRRQDPQSQGGSLLADYIASGWQAGKGPHPLFDSDGYRRRYLQPDHDDINPLADFLSQGYRRDRNPHPLFDCRYYDQRYAATRRADENPLIDYLTEGWRLDRRPHPLFDPAWYRESAPETADGRQNLLIHYLTVGGRSGCDPHPLFDTAFYYQQCPELIDTDVVPLVHYLESGWKMGRIPHPAVETLCTGDREIAADGESPLVAAIRTAGSQADDPGWSPGSRHEINRLDDGSAKPGPGLHRHRSLRISIVTPVHDPPLDVLASCLESVRCQDYSDWQLCLVDDGGVDPQVQRLLEETAKADERIRMRRLPRNRGIAAATNAALVLADGDYVGFLDHDDELAPGALKAVAAALLQNDADLLYTDEDLIAPDGRRTGALRKPGFSPDLLFTHNYINHFWVARRELITRAGGMDPSCDGAQDFDLLLKLTDRNVRIHHLPRALYRWRSATQSTSSDPAAKGYADHAGQHALRNALARRGIDGRVLKTDRRFFYRVRRRLKRRPPVQLLVGLPAGMPLPETWLGALLEHTEYPELQAVVVAAGSLPETNPADSDARRWRVVSCGPAPVAVGINRAALSEAGTHLVFIAPGLLPESADWIEPLLEHSQRRQVGAVGGHWIAAPETIAAGGLHVTLADIAARPWGHFPGSASTHALGLECTQNVTAACGGLMMVRREVFADAGGMNPDYTIPMLGDLDLCLRLRQQGLLIVHTPYCRARAGRIGPLPPSPAAAILRLQLVRFMERWRLQLEAGDPYYNPGLPRQRSSFSPFGLLSPRRPERRQYSGGCEKRESS